MSDLTPTTPPAVSPRVRTVTYYVALTVSALVLLTTGLGSIFYPDAASQIAAAGGVVTSVVALVTGGLGVAYRPTRAVES